MPIRWAYLKRVLAGAIFGLYIANLLYFLNPQIDITPGRLATVTIVYSLICGVLFGSVLWLLRALRVRIFGKPETHGGFRPHGFRAAADLVRRTQRRPENVAHSFRCGRGADRGVVVLPLSTPRPLSHGDASRRRRRHRHGGRQAPRDHGRHPQSSVRLDPDDG